MIGAIIGDVVGSVYEFDNLRSKAFPFLTKRNFFTDDSVLTVATAEAFLRSESFADVYRNFARMYPNRGYGGMFQQWVKDGGAGAYGSFGNGSAMRVGPVAYVANSLAEAMTLAKLSAEATHNHPEGIKGAQAVAAAVFLARQKRPIPEIKREIEFRFGYRLDQTVAEIRPNYSFDETCQGTVPQAMACAFEADSFEDAIRNGVSIGGDTDTVCCIAGSVAEPLFGVPADLAAAARSYLSPHLLSVIDEFLKRYPGSHSDLKHK
jgi:ADP-ribosyl-[dinitrogen reductase] hydrolase